jgi:hypothetical protein
MTICGKETIIFLSLYAIMPPVWPSVGRDKL